MVTDFFFQVASVSSDQEKCGVASLFQGARGLSPATEQGFNPQETVLKEAALTNSSTHSLIL